jgi:hypothetical protein
VSLASIMSEHHRCIECEYNPLWLEPAPQSFWSLSSVVQQNVYLW